MFNPVSRNNDDMVSCVNCVHNDDIVSCVNCAHNDDMVSCVNCAHNDDVPGDGNVCQTAKQTQCHRNCDVKGAVTSDMVQSDVSNICE